MIEVDGIFWIVFAVVGLMVAVVIRSNAGVPNIEPSDDEDTVPLPEVKSERTIQDPDRGFYVL